MFCAINLGDYKVSGKFYVAFGTVFLLFSCCVLTIAAVAKLITTTETVGMPILFMRDPVLPFLTNREIIRLAAFSELAIVLFVICNRSAILKFAAISWLSAIFLAYRLGLVLVGAPKTHCPCLGSIPGTIGISESTASSLALSFAAIMFIGSNIMAIHLCIAGKSMRKSLPLIALLLFWSHSSLANPPLAVNGIITATQIGLEGGKSVVKTNSFSVLLNSTNTVIQTGAMNMPQFDHFEYGSLSNGSYLLVMFDTNFTFNESWQIRDNVITKVRSKSPKKSVNQAMLYLNSWSVPDYGNGLMTPVWIAYCFADDLGLHNTDTVQTVPLFPIAQEFLTNGGQSSVHYTLSSRAPFMLESMYEVITSPASSSSHYLTNGNYVVIEWTNYNGLALPWHFRATQYRFNEAGDSFPAVIFDGHAMSVSPILSGPPNLSIPAITRVVERRRAVLGEFGEMAYTTTNGILWGKDEVLRHPNLISHYAGTLVDRPRGRVIAYTVLWTLVIMPPFLLAWYHRARNQSDIPP